VSSPGVDAVQALNVSSKIHNILRWQVARNLLDSVFIIHLDDNYTSSVEAGKRMANNESPKRCARDYRRRYTMCVYRFVKVSIPV